MKTGIDKIIDKVNFQLEIVEMDFNNGVEISMRVFNKMLKEIKTQCEKEKAKERQQAFEFWQGGIKCTEEGGKSFDQYYNETYKK
jgi:hypothetical protein